MTRLPHWARGVGPLQVPSAFPQFPAMSLWWVNQWLLWSPSIPVQDRAPLALLLQAPLVYHGSLHGSQQAGPGAVGDPGLRDT